jgi:hypothetical protein
MFAGIVHEVGGFYLISRAAEYPGLLDEDFSAWNETGEAELGRALLKVLGVPQAVVDAIEVCWAGYLAMPPTTLGDTPAAGRRTGAGGKPLARSRRGSARRARRQRSICLSAGKRWSKSCRSRPKTCDRWRRLCACEHLLHGA